MAVRGTVSGEVPEHFPFWAWSLRVYARPAVAAACLELQDRHGLDVNLLLFGLWLATGGRSLGDDVASAAARLGRLAADARCWHGDVVVPLRAARRAMKRAGGGLVQGPGPGRPAGPGQDLDAAAAALRERLQAIELDAERVEQWLLFLAAGSLPALPLEGDPTAADAPVRATRARRHLDAVQVLTGVQWDEQDLPALAVLVGAAVHDVTNDMS